MKYRKLSLLILMLLLAAVMASCGKKIDTEEVRKYSDAALENILKAANKDDYAAYSKDFSDKMKEAVNEKLFKEQNKMIKDKIGEYTSKEFVKATPTKEKGIDYVTVIYTAKYSDEPKGVMVSITFRPDDNNHKVEGIFMTSPKLASK